MNLVDFDFTRIERNVLASVRIVESMDMVKQVEDWSRVRSPSRARRRLRQGHRQNIRVITVPRTDLITIDNGMTYIVHPSVAHSLRQRFSHQIDAEMQRTILNGDAL